MTTLASQKTLAQSWTVASDRWSAAWAGWSDPDAIVLAERPDQVVFAHRGDVPEGPWDRGDCFTADWHVTWQRLGARVRVVLVGTEPPEGLAALGPPDDTLDLSGAASPQAEEMILWGVKNADAPLWIELRVPHLMRPPQLHPAGHAMPPDGEAARRLLQVTSYFDAQTGDFLIHRYTGIRHALTERDGTNLDKEARD